MYIIYNHILFMYIIFNIYNIYVYDVVQAGTTIVFENKGLYNLYVYRYYLWVDDKSKKSRVSSPQYVDFVMTFVQKTVNDETLFPTKEPEQNTKIN